MSLEYEKWKNEVEFFVAYYRSGDDKKFILRERDFMESFKYIIKVSNKKNRCVSK